MNAEILKMPNNSVSIKINGVRVEYSCVDAEYNRYVIFENGEERVVSADGACDISVDLSMLNLGDTVECVLERGDVNELLPCEPHMLAVICDDGDMIIGISTLNSEYFCKQSMAEFVLPYSTSQVPHGIVLTITKNPNTADAAVQRLATFSVIYCDRTHDYANELVRFLAS